ncbi:MAG: helix-turn-helix transcriptional regulator [Bacillota bacterium]
MFSYKPLLKLMIDKNVNKSHLRSDLGLSPNTIAKIAKNEYISFEVLDKLCAYFDVQPDQIFEYVPEEK